mmetsp:Transcript_26675/g.85618  ORF Transcript_26675/g.85618 Transcript_26675/m.85618 type:complete len:259 (-) Transcript_26675:75-851(-)
MAPLRSNHLANPSQNSSSVLTAEAMGQGHGKALDAPEKERIVVIGGGGHARVIIAAIRAEGRYELVGVIDEAIPVGELVLGVAPVLGKLAELPTLAAAHGLGGYVVAIGDNFVRQKVTAQAQEVVPGLALALVVHPRAAVAEGVEVGAGSVVFAGAVVAPGARVGVGCILNHGASLDHDSIMEDYSALGPGAAVCGAVKIGQGSWISSGATVIHMVTIGCNTVVGAGATVVKPLPDDVLAVGTPARVVRGRRAGEKFL